MTCKCIETLNVLIKTLLLLLLLLIILSFRTQGECTKDVYFNILKKKK